jgi:predicted GH43/DUF377 family glycosyl hydrolase
MRNRHSKAPGALALAAALLLSGATLAEAAPRCRFPGPFNRVGGEARRTDGQHLSPYRIAGDPSVIRRGDHYELFFTSADRRRRAGIARAESRDGLSWTVWRNAANPDPVMDLALPPPDDSWEAPGIENANVLVGPDGLFRMYYTGNRVPEGSLHFAIGLATSPDGIRWTRHPTPVLEPMHDWEQPVCGQRGDPRSCHHGGVLEPSVIYDARTRLYRMWYAGLGEPSDSYRTFRVGYATSPDGIAWARQSRPVFLPAGEGAWDQVWTSHVNVVADPVEGFHMFYFGTALAEYRDGAEMQRGAIGHAWSPDGIRWERNPANPILRPRPGQADAWTVGGPTALIENGRIRLWYFGGRTSAITSDIMLAEARCGG